MHFFWANIKKSYNEVIHNNFLWAPAYAIQKNGSKITDAGWKEMPNIRKGDHIICYRYGEIIGIAQALCDAYNSPRPETREFDQWKNEGYRVDISLTLLAEPIELDLYREHIYATYNDLCKPRLLTINKDVSQNYLVSIPAGLAVTIFGDMNISFLDESKPIDNQSTPKTTANVNQTVRVGQSGFRKKVLSYWKNSCPITNISTQELLIASHIVPWCLASDKERLDPFNGIALSPTFDKLFDKGFISFSDSGKMLINENTDSDILKKLNISIGCAIDNFDDRHVKYLKRHRELFNFS